MSASDTCLCSSFFDRLEESTEDTLDPSFSDRSES